MNYFTLSALAEEWDRVLVNSVVQDIWSQSPNELSFGLGKDGNQHTLRIHCDPKLALLFRSDGYGRAKRNSATLFSELHGEAVKYLTCANRDRFLFIGFEDDSSFQVQLFGSRPNVFLVRENRVEASFLLSDQWLGQEAPQPRSAPVVETVEAFAQRWSPKRNTIAQAVSRAIPLFNAKLAAEAVYRSGLAQDLSPADVGEHQLSVLFASVEEIRAALQRPRPTIYWRGRLAEEFSLIELQSMGSSLRAEPFDSVDEAMAVFSKRRLGQRRFFELYKPVEMALEKAARKHTRSADSMMRELGSPSRAEKYEAWGHLLMAQATSLKPGREEITVPDILHDGSEITIKLDPKLSGIENAQRYYEKARHTRESRRHAERRWMEVQKQAQEATELLSQLRQVDEHTALEAFLQNRKKQLDQYIKPESVGKDRVPYRRFELDGWEVRVGKNARSNHELTTRHAGPHDFWLHARGVPGSHVVICRPNKTEEIPKGVVEKAARIAAHFSDAKTQSLAPVIVTERKYVRPVKGAAPGLVRVDREDVVMVKPGLPV